MKYFWFSLFSLLTTHSFAWAHCRGLSGEALLFCEGVETLEAGRNCSTDRGQYLCRILDHLIKTGDCQFPLSRSTDSAPVICNDIRIGFNQASCSEVPLADSHSYCAWGKVLRNRPIFVDLFQLESLKRIFREVKANDGSPLFSEAWVEHGARIWPHFTKTAPNISFEQYTRFIWEISQVVPHVREKFLASQKTQIFSLDEPVNGIPAPSAIVVTAKKGSAGQEVIHLLLGSIRIGNQQITLEPVVTGAHKIHELSYNLTERKVELQSYAASEEDDTAFIGEYEKQSHLSFQGLYGGIKPIPPILLQDHSKLFLQNFYPYQEHLLGLAYSNSVIQGMRHEEFKLKVAIGIIAAVRSLHLSGHIHRDIKLENFILEIGSDGEPKIHLADFSFVRSEFDLSGSQVFGSPHYSTPEYAAVVGPYLQIGMTEELFQYLGGLSRDKSQDLWAVGMTLAELLFPRFETGYNEVGFFARLAAVSERPDYFESVLNLAGFEQPPLENPYLQIIYQQAKSLVQKNPKNRVSLDSVLEALLKAKRDLENDPAMASPFDIRINPLVSPRKPAREREPTVLPPVKKLRPLKIGSV